MMHATDRRLLLRDIEPGDVEAVHAFAADPAVTRWTDGGPNSRSDSRAFVDGAAAEAAAAVRPAFTLAVVRHADDRLIGTAAVWTSSAAHRRGGLGCALHRDAWGQGIATETAGLLLRLGAERLGLHRIEATCHPDNRASTRVLEKAGLRREGRLADHLLVRGEWRDSLLYAVVL